MSSYLRVMFDVYPIVRDNVPAPTKASFTSYIKARLSEQNDIGRAIWDGEGWESIRAPDSKYNYLKDIIKDIMQKEPDDNRIVNDIRNHNIGNDINSYLNLDPDVYEVELEISNVNESDSEGISCTDDGRYKVENGAEIKLTSRLGPFNIIHWVPFLHSKNFYYELVGTGQEEKTKRVEIGKYNEHRISIPRSTPSEQEKIILKLRGENHNGKQTEPYEINISW